MRKNLTPKERVHIWLDTEVNAKLHLYFDVNPGYSAAINTILKAAIKRIEGNGLEGVAQPVAVATSSAEELFDA